MTRLPRPRCIRPIGVVLTAVLSASTAGCGGDTNPAMGSQPPADAAHSTSAGDRVVAASETTDLYDVGGHRLYMSCAGAGPVTVVYVHGWVNDAEYVPHNSALGIRNLLDDDYRVCLYDRRNVGSSDTVDAIQRPADIVRDMEGVLAGGGVDPPYILMAASFGGLVAHAYLNEHPDDVIGMVLIDTMFPDELALDRFLPRDARFVYYDKDDKCCTLERISQFALISSLRPHIGKEPAIPAIYLASEQEPRDQNDYGSPEYDARVLAAQAGYVDRFSPGVLRWVDAPHFMEPVLPEVIADAVREVDELAAR